MVDKKRYKTIGFGCALVTGGESLPIPSHALTVPEPNTMGAEAVSLSSQVELPIQSASGHCFR